MSPSKYSIKSKIRVHVLFLYFGAGCGTGRLLEVSARHSEVWGNSSANRPVQTFLHGAFFSLQRGPIPLRDHGHFQTPRVLQKSVGCEGLGDQLVKRTSWERPWLMSSINAFPRPNLWTGLEFRGTTVFLLLVIGWELQVSQGLLPVALSGNRLLLKTWGREKAPSQLKYVNWFY